MALQRDLLSPLRAELSTPSLSRVDVYSSLFLPSPSCLLAQTNVVPEPTWSRWSESSKKSWALGTSVHTVAPGRYPRCPDLDVETARRPALASPRHLERTRNWYRPPQIRTSCLFSLGLHVLYLMVSEEKRFHLSDLGSDDQSWEWDAGDPRAHGLGLLDKLV